MSDKLPGYILLVVGITLMFLSVLEVYLVFTGKMLPYQIFRLPGISLDLSGIAGSDLPEEQAQMLRQSKNLKTELLGADVLNQPLNLFAFIMFMGFIANIGFKVANLGVLFLRPIKVNLKSAVAKEGGE